MPNQHNPGYQILTRTQGGHQPASILPEKELEYRRRERKLEAAAVRIGGLEIGYDKFDELSPIILKRIDEYFRDRISYNVADKTLNFMGLSKDQIYLIMKDVADTNFYELLQFVYSKMESLLSENEEKVQQDHLAEKDWIKWRDEEITLIFNELNQSRVVPQKPAKREFSEEETARFLDYREKSSENLEKRQQIILTEENRINKKVKNLKSQIEAARNACEPYNHKVSELEEKLKSDLNEADFKDTKLSLEFNQNKLLKLNTEIEICEAGLAELEEKLTSFELEKNTINLCLEAIRFSKDWGVNWAKRRKSVVARVERLLADRAGLYARREHLNAEWARITGDSEELIRPLNYAERFVVAF